MMRKGSKFEADPLRQNADSIYSSAFYEPNVASRTRKRAGLAMFKPSNAIRRERFVAIYEPIGSQRHGAGCGLTTMMSFYGTPVAQVFMEGIMPLFRGTQAMIRLQPINH